MSNLLILVKILTAIYQAKKINDKNLTDECLDLIKMLPKSSADVFM